MASKTVPCTNPQICGVKSHESRSHRARNCERMSSADALHATSQNKSDLDRRAEKSPEMDTILGISFERVPVEFNQAYREEIDSDARTLSTRAGAVVSYRLPTPIAGVHLEITPRSLDAHEVGVFWTLHLADGNRVFAYPNLKQKNRDQVLRDGTRVTTPLLPVVLDESGNQQDGSHLLTLAELGVLSDEMDTVNELSRSECYDNRELIARLVWKRENAIATFGE